jgi:flagella basal body P-ring formation protein FlgA
MMIKQKRKSCQSAQLSSILLCCLLSLQTADAETPQEMTRIAHEYMLTHLDPLLRNPSLSLTPLSATAKTPTCQQPIQIRWNSGRKTGNINLTLSCPNPKWQRYVNAKISGELPVVITNNDLPAGSNITASDVHIGWLPDSQIRQNQLTSLTDIENLSTRQFIGAGSALSSNQVRARILVHKGDQVRIIAGDNEVAIEVAGTALESGEKGKQIRVQNLSSQKIIKGKILSADSVIVP